MSLLTLSSDMLRAGLEQHELASVHDKGVKPGSVLIGLAVSIAAGLIGLAVFH